MRSREEIRREVEHLEKETFPDRLFYGFACSLFGAGITMAVLFWTSVDGSWKLFAMTMGVTFLGGCFYGARFLNVVGDVLRRIW